MPASTKRILVALSGGVDSSACVYLLQQSGWQVDAVVLDLSPAHSGAVLAAQETADRLGIPLHIVREHEAFRRDVILPFCQAYRCGFTPNPCIVCNPGTKFRLLLRTAGELGIHYIATGHYACIEQAGTADSPYWVLKRAKCRQRDQSYMLYRLGQEALSRLILPLQSLSKEEVRAIAREAALPCAQKPDSQEICFIPDHDYSAYIEAVAGPCPPGDFIAPDGTPCGTHKGILHYTVGQRKGLGIALGRPVFVSRIDAKENRVYLAEQGEEYAKGVQLSDCVFSPGFEPGKGFVKIRSMAPLAPADIQVKGEGLVHVVFDVPQRAPAPGQSTVWYQDDIVAGGGVIAGHLA